MNKFLFKSKLFLQRNSSTILTCVGSVGVVATVFTAVKATPKAIALIKDAEAEKGEELTKVETALVAAPAYIAPAVLGVSALACIFGANILSQRQQASMMGAYALLDNSFKEFKAKVQELYGEGTVSVVRGEIAKDHYEDDDVQVDDGKQLFYDEFSNRYFESTMENVLNAELQINRLLAQDGGVYLNEFYEFLGIPTIEYGDYMGWSSFALCDMYWWSWIEFRHEKVTMDDGLECTIIVMGYEPLYDFENY